MTFKSLVLAICVGSLCLGAMSCCNCTWSVTSDSGSWSFGSGVKGSGHIIQIKRDIADFDQIKISHAFRATVKRGDDHEVSVKTDDNLVEMLEILKEGRTLYLGLKPGSSVNNGTFVAEITLPDLVSLECSGASDVNLVGVASNKPLRVDLSGASRAVVQGACGDLFLELSGASRVDASALSCANIHAILSGASQAEVLTSGRLDCDASGASRLTYGGNPNLGAISTSGASEVEQRSVN